MAQLNKKIIAIAVAVVVCVAASFWPQEREENAVKLQEQAVQFEEEPAEAKITVYVSGAVVKPGLHEVPAGCRAVEAVAIAGGMTDEANKDKVNLAKICKDGMQINVPRLNAKELKKLRAGQSVVFAGRTSCAAPAAADNTVIISAESGSPGGKISLTHASAEELEELPGVGGVTAQRIVEYRSRHGFSRIEDLMNVKGIGQAKFDKMRPYLDL